MSDLLKVERCWSSEREGGLGLWKDDWRSVKEEMVEVVEGQRTHLQKGSTHIVDYIELVRQNLYQIDCLLYISGSLMHSNVFFSMSQKYHKGNLLEGHRIK